MFNVRNALAATAAATAVGIPPEKAAAGLSTFRGVRRRLERRGVARGVEVYDDFAHHPTAVRETLAAVRETAPVGRIWAVFEPRSATACRRVFQRAFAEALAVADRVVIGPVYRSSLSESERLSAPTLAADIAEAGVPARHLDSVDDIVDIVGSEARDGDLVVVMSNGDFGGVHQRLLDRLAAAA